MGLYKLKKTKIKSDDWMVIVDASIQMGQKKLLLIAGIRQSDMPINRPLEIKDLEVLAARFTSKLESCFVNTVLNEVELSVGKIISICSDRGSDILRGVRNYQINNSDTKHFSDTAHRVANFLKSSLEKDKRWETFRKEVTSARKKMQNSLIAGALPPSPRTKARFMNVDSLVKWAMNMLTLLESPKIFEQSLIDITELEFKKYLGWLSDYKHEIYLWNKMVCIGSIARDLVRREGIHSEIAENFEQALHSIPFGCRELEFADRLLEFFLDQSYGLQPGERYIGSTEVIESFFGKLKFMEREQTAFGFTSLVLAALACIGPSDEETVKKAIESVKVSEIEEWTKREVGETVQSQRKQISGIISKIISKMGPKVSGFFWGGVMGY